jgi:hypothetical protein
MARIPDKRSVEELTADLDSALAARNGPRISKCYRALSAQRRSGKVGRRRACPVCKALSRAEISGEVIHAPGCSLDGALRRAEAFVSNALRMSQGK